MVLIIFTPRKSMSIKQVTEFYFKIIFQLELHQVSFSQPVQRLRICHTDLIIWFLCFLQNNVIKIIALYCNILRN